MFRFSERFHRHKLAAQRTESAIEEARLAMERERKVNRRWRMRHPERNPAPLFKEWQTNKAKTSQDYSRLIVAFMSAFDGVSEANKMMRHGLEAGDAEIPLEEFEALAQSTFNLRLFEMFADHCGLSPYTRELVLQRLVTQAFPGVTMQKPNRGFAMEVMSMEPPPPAEPRRRPKT